MGTGQVHVLAHDSYIHSGVQMRRFQCQALDCIDAIVCINRPYQVIFFSSFTLVFVAVVISFHCIHQN